jgi:hypothetical protein
VEYRFTAANSGPDAATGITVATTLPAGATAEPSSGCSAAGAVVTCLLPDVPAGGSAGGAIAVRHGSPGTKTVTSAVHSQTQDGNASNDTATATTAVEPAAVPAGAGVSVAVSDSPDPVSVLQNVAYTVQVSNAGPLAADAVSLVMDVDDVVVRDHAAPRLHPAAVPDHHGDLRSRLARGGRQRRQGARRELERGGRSDRQGDVTATGPADPDLTDNTETETTTVS